MLHAHAIALRINNNALGSQMLFASKRTVWLFDDVPGSYLPDIVEQLFPHHRILLAPGLKLLDARLRNSRLPLACLTNTKRANAVTQCVNSARHSRTAADGETSVWLCQARRRFSFITTREGDKQAK
jgi:hypothetical protein